MYAYFVKWRDDRILERVFYALSADADMKNLSLDSMYIKVHESTNGGGKQWKKQLLRQWWIEHNAATIADGLGNLGTFRLSAGNDHDYQIRLNMTK